MKIPQTYSRLGIGLGLTHLVLAFLTLKFDTNAMLQSVFYPLNLEIVLLSWGGAGRSLYFMFFVYGVIKWYLVGWVISKMFSPKTKSSYIEHADVKFPKKCPKCGNGYDNSWKICLNDSSTLVPNESS